VGAGDLEEHAVDARARLVREPSDAAAPPARRKVIDQRDVAGFGELALRELEARVAVLAAPLVERRAVQDGRVGKVEPRRLARGLRAQLLHLIVVAVHARTITAADWSGRNRPDWHSRAVQHRGTLTPMTTPFSFILQVPAAPPEEALKHFAGKL